MAWYGQPSVTNVSPDALAPSVLLTSGNSGALYSAQLYPLFSLTSPTASDYAVVAMVSP